jgi:NADH:ubiquinone oxidoreductase subunit 4 (subunit M)
LTLIILTAFLIVLACGCRVSNHCISAKAVFVISLLILERLFAGVFGTLEHLFAVCVFEAMLIPMFVVIGIWEIAARRL